MKMKMKSFHFYYYSNDYMCVDGTKNNWINVLILLFAHNLKWLEQVTNQISKCLTVDNFTEK